MMRSSILKCLLVLTAIYPVYASDEEAPQLIPSTPAEIAAMSGIPAALVDGKISTASGALVLQSTDLIAQGAEPITLDRTYVSPTLLASYHPVEGEDLLQLYKSSPWYGGWSIMHHLNARLEKDERGYLFTAAEPNGLTLQYQIGFDGDCRFMGQQEGIHNVGPEGPSACHDPRNTQIEVVGDGKNVLMKKPNGLVREYWLAFLETPQGPVPSWILKREILPNGKVLRYERNSFAQVVAVTSHDPQERYTYATLRWVREGERCWRFQTHTGLEASYIFEKRTLSKEWGGRRHNREIYLNSRPLLVAVSSPQFRHEEIAYTDRFLLETLSRRGEDFKLNYTHPTGHVPITIASLSKPMGEKGELQVTHQISQGSTFKAIHPDGAYDIIHYAHFLVSKIEHFAPDGQLVYQEAFSWGPNGWLKSSAASDKDEKLLYRRSYQYDSVGNPIEEDFFDPVSDQTQRIHRRYSQVRPYNLLEESIEGEVTTRYTYLPGTILPTSRLVGDGQQLLQRRFWLYDAHHNLIEEIEDDGPGDRAEDLSNVSERRIITYHLRQQGPFLHMRDCIEERYWEGEGLHPLRKTHVHYDDLGNICQEDVYDATGILAFSLFKTFDEQGNLLSETNPLGERATGIFDPQGRKTVSTDFAQNTTDYVYDPAGRLVHSSTHTPDGLHEGRSYRYHLQKQPISEANHLDHRTDYRYDPVSQALVETIGPPISDGQSVVTTSQLDRLGRPIATTDPNGHTTRRRLTARGEPLTIEHPNGAIEHYRYDSHSRLISHTDSEGTEIRYHRDPLGRIVRKSYHSPSGGEIASETFVYRGYRLAQETDREGKTTRYGYDGAGRKIAEESAGRVICFAYDPLGQLAQIERGHGNERLITFFTRDLLGRILVEEQRDGLGVLLNRIAHTYDARGHITSTTYYTSPLEGSTEEWVYDGLGRQIRYTDPLGRETLTSYSEDALDFVSGLTLERLVTQSPNGCTTSRVLDPYNRLLTLTQQDRSGAPLFHQERTYDPSGNLILEQVTSPPHGTITTRWEYDPCNREVLCVEADGSPDAKKTRCHYFPSGRLQAKELPGGSSVHYTYHPLGYLTALTASGLSYRYSCNLQGRLIEAHDQISGQSVRRTLDPFGNVLCEILPNGLTISATYDSFDRPLTITYPDRSQVRYRYNPARLLQVERWDPSGILQYTHSYTYDLRGQPVKEALIANLGTISRTYDQAGDPLSITSPYFSQTLLDRDCAGNPLLIQEEGGRRSFTYDSLSQLISEEPPSHSYTYDAFHNCLSKDGAMGQFNSLHQLLNRGERAFSYDPQGRLTHTPDESYSYDPLDRLIRYQKGNLTVTYTYDPLGRRLAKQVHDGQAWIWQDAEERYFYYGNVELGACDSQGTITQARVLGRRPAHDIGSAIAVEIQGKPYAPLHDLQGNVRVLVDLYGNIQGTYAYTAFGEHLGTPSFSTPWQYQSKRWDSETGLYLFGKRYYDPKTARWLTRDPAGRAQSFNPYQYCLNNPWCYIDPNGDFVFLLAIPIIYAGSWATGAVITNAAIVAVCAASAAYGCNELAKRLNRSSCERSYSSEPRFVGGSLYAPSVAGTALLGGQLFAPQYLKADTTTDISKEAKQKDNANPFKGPVIDDVVVVDEAGNAMQVPSGNWLTGTKDGKWIQERAPDGTIKGQATGQRKDGAHNPSPIHTDSRSLRPHAHVPGVTNPDGTPWLPIH